jgi:hypothetical protein
MNRHAASPASAALATLATLLAGAFAGAPLAAAPLYTIAFRNQPEVYSATPFGRDSTYALAPSNGEGVTSVHGYAMAGRVGATQHMEMTWTGYSGTFASSCYARCRTDDFIITGPAGPTSVAGTLHLRLKSTHALSGGYAGHGGHASTVGVSVQALQAFWPFSTYGQVFGDYRYTNAGPFSSGCLTGQTGSSLDVPFTLAANFPVNVPFAVDLRVEAGGTGYGNFSTNPGSVDCDAGGVSTEPFTNGLWLEAVKGQVITLPEGYTLNAPSWGIVNNTVGVDEGAAAHELRLALTPAGANPFTREARVALDLPRAGKARVAVFGVDGRALRTLVDGWMPAGRSDVVWDGRGADGAAVAAGIYFVQAESGGERATTRLVRLQP